MGSNLESQILNNNHGERVTSLETGFTGLKDSMNQHRNEFNSKMVSKWYLAKLNVYEFYRISFQNAMGSEMKTMISNVDHGDRVALLESGFTGLEDSLDQHRIHFDSKMVKNASNNFVQ